MQNSKATKQNGSYHHGNLKRALVDAYIELLETVPVEKLSLRKLAGHVGVAPTAVYNHFADKEALRSEIKLRCLRHFTEYLNNSSEGEQSPEKRIRNLGRAYFQYSVEHVRYFEMMFQDELPDESITQELIDASTAAEMSVRSAVVDLLRKHNLPLNPYTEGLGTFTCWSLAHGVSALAAKHVNHNACMSGRWPQEFMLCDKESIKASFGAMTDVLVAGLISTAKDYASK